MPLMVLTLTYKRIYSAIEDITKEASMATNEQKGGFSLFGIFGRGKDTIAKETNGEQAQRIFDDLSGDIKKLGEKMAPYNDPESGATFESWVFPRSRAEQRVRLTEEHHGEVVTITKITRTSGGVDYEALIFNITPGGVPLDVTATRTMENMVVLDKPSDIETVYQQMRTQLGPKPDEGKK
jgi:hypothetical protein